MSSKNKRILAVAVAVLVIALSLTVVFSENLASNKTDAFNEKLVRVACLGDSITNMTGYPDDLQSLLGNTSAVGNFGVNGATVNLNSLKPYYYDLVYRDARNFQPTTVVIMLGTNDARTDTYTKIDNFTSNYERLINRTQRWNSTQQIFLVIPPPIFTNALNLSSTDFVQGVIPRIQQVAKDMNVSLIDLYTPLKDHPEYFRDGVHPNSEGTKIIAQTIYKAIK